MKKQFINPETNVPYIIPEKASETLNLRITKDQKEYIRGLSKRQKRSMTKIALHVLKTHLFQNVQFLL